jgi:predicted alpha/beta-hydrolase family hydrolase
VTTTAEWSVPVGDQHTRAIYDEAAPGNPVFVCAHGAGGNLADRATLATARALRDEGVGVVRFNFLYRERKSGRPDPMPKLMDTFAAVVEHARP